MTEEFTDVPGLEEISSLGWFGYHLVGYDDLPSYLRSNPCVKQFYRPHLSIAEAMKSIFQFHNEFWNIWTHLLGSIMFTILMILSFFTWLEDGNSLDKTVFLMFVLSAQLLLFLSSFFHLISCSSQCSSEYSYYARLDYTGIAVLISGAVYSPIYYTFICMPWLTIFYTGGISFLGIVAICVTFHPAFEKAGLEFVRAGVFVAMAMFAATAGIPALYYHGFSILWPLAWRCILMGACYLIGVVFYVSKFPECKFPGKFDRGLRSHVIWHLWVVAGTLAQYFVVKYCYQSQFGLSCLQ